MQPDKLPRLDPLTAAGMQEEWGSRERPSMTWLFMSLGFFVLALLAPAGATQGQLDGRFGQGGFARTTLGASGLLRATGVTRLGGPRVTAARCNLFERRSGR